MPGDKNKTCWCIHYAVVSTCRGERTIKPKQLEVSKISCCIFFFINFRWGDGDSLIETQASTVVPVTINASQN